MRRIKLSIIRHGQTDCNLRGVLQGQMDTPLNETGKLEASKLGERLKNESVSFVLSSQLDRALETIKIVMSHKSDSVVRKLPIEIDKRLQERAFGIFEGQPKGLLSDAHNKAAQEKDYPGRRHFIPKKGESMAQVYMRARVVLLEILSNIVNGECSPKPDNEEEITHILISTHGGVAIELISFLVKELGCGPPEGVTKSQMIAIPGNTALAQFILTLVPTTVSFQEIIARPKDLIDESICLTIHDRSHCDQSYKAGTTVY